MYAPEELAPFYQQISATVMRTLPSDISEQLVWNRKPIRHTIKNDMILFNAWNKFQTGLERNQFNYCLNYKPLRPEEGGLIWLLQIRCNIERICKMFPSVREAIRLEVRRLGAVCPKPFVYRENTQTVELRYTFNFEHSLSGLHDFLVPLYLRLITASHPTLVKAIDLFHGKNPHEIKLEHVGDLPLRHLQIRRDLAIFGAQPTAAMKPIILERYGKLCAFCGKPVAKGDLEFHHLKLRSRGGKRITENFAPLHVACHDEVHRFEDKDGVIPDEILRQPGSN